MAGHTGVGVYPESFKESDLHLSISQVAELHEVEYDKKKLFLEWAVWSEIVIWSLLKKVKVNVKEQSDQSQRKWKWKINLIKVKEIESERAIWSKWRSDLIKS